VKNKTFLVVFCDAPKARPSVPAPSHAAPPASSNSRRLKFLDISLVSSVRIKGGELATNAWSPRLNCLLYPRSGAKETSKRGSSPLLTSPATVDMAGPRSTACGPNG